MHYILLPLYISCENIQCCMFFHIYLYGDVINQVSHFKTDTSKIIEKIIECVMISKCLLGADFAKYVKQMQC